MRIRGSSRDEISKRVLAARMYGDDARKSERPAAVRFTQAYEACRMWCEIVLRAEGYLVKGSTGHHERIIAAIPLYLGAQAEPIAAHLQEARRSRNRVMYDGEIGFVTAAETELLLETLTQLESAVNIWLQEKHPDLLPLV